MAEEIMDVEQQSTNSKNPETGELNSSEENSDENKIIDYLITCKDVYYKSQQRGEIELTPNEKKEIACTIFSQSKSNFLCRFGKHLKEQHLDYFKQFLSDENDGYAIGYYLSDLKRFFTKSKREKDIKNRRYDALKRLVEENSYFTETEMMKRNPLLYDQLVGQYLSDEEKKKRDNIDTKNITFVNLLLESIDRDTIRKKQKQQQDDEECTMEENDSDESENDDDKKMSPKNQESDSWDDEKTDKTTKWGEFPDSSSVASSSQPTRRFDNFFFDPEASKPKEVIMITATERRLLKEEFISIMYQNFLDGKDLDFDYTTVDDNDEYDNLDIKTHDAEDSYFDSETPEDIPLNDARMASENETSEDELDVFMSRLNKHPTVQQISENLTNL